MSALNATACRYLSAGWAVLPIQPIVMEAGKKVIRPVLPWSDIDRMPTYAALAALEGVWSREWPADYGMAVLLGPSNVAVVDVDSHAALPGILATCPPTLLSLTGKGAHLFYSRPPTTPRTRAIHKGASGDVDVLSAGLLIIPPTCHPSGTGYQWASDPWESLQHLPEPPQWVLDTLDKPPATGLPEVAVDLQALAKADIPPAITMLGWGGKRMVEVFNYLDRGIVPPDRSACVFLVVKHMLERGYTDLVIVATLLRTRLVDRATERNGETAVEFTLRELSRIKAYINHPRKQA